MIDHTTFRDATFLENLEDHQQKEYFKLDGEWLKLKADLDPEGYKELMADWYAHEEDAKYWRQFEKDKTSSKLTNEGWSQIPALVVPDLLRNQMERRFGPAWSSFGVLRYGIWKFYPKLRTTQRYYGKKKGISRRHLSDNFNIAGNQKEKS